MRQGVGPPSTGSTGATVCTVLGRDSEARELRAELGGHSLIPRIDRPRSQLVSQAIRFFPRAHARGKRGGGREGKIRLVRCARVPFQSRM